MKIYYKEPKYFDILLECEEENARLRSYTNYDVIYKNGEMKQVFSCFHYRRLVELIKQYIMDSGVHVKTITIFDDFSSFPIRKYKVFNNNTFKKIRKDIQYELCF